MSPLEIMQKARLLDWDTLMIGFQNGWCNIDDVVNFAEECLLKCVDGVDVGLVSIVAGTSLERDEFLSTCVNYLKSHGHLFDENVKNSALTKWRFALLSALLASSASEEQKIEDLQVLYSQFGFPEDMASCSIYSGDGVDPISAAQAAVNKLAQRFSATPPLKGS